MTPFTTLTAVAAPMPTANVDTDQIIPARYLPKPRPELKNGMFHDLRFNSDGSPKPDFVLNKPAYGNAQILVAERNFACGSSREHAVICMLDNGFRAFIAPSFGDIFFSNCYQNGALPILAASVLTSEELVIRNVPRIRDVDAMLAAGAGLEAAMRIANRAAGIVVGKLGTATASPAELFGERRKMSRKD